MGAGMWLRFASYLLLSAAACSDAQRVRPGPPEREHDASVADAALAEPREPIAIEWRSTSSPLEADGRTQRVAFSVPDTPAVFGVRAYAESAAVSSKLCFALEEVVVAGDQTWVPVAAPRDYDDYCETCAQRSASGAGYGFFSLPSGDEPPSQRK